jgi:hypothetical protein
LAKARPVSTLYSFTNREEKLENNQILPEKTWIMILKTVIDNEYHRPK